MLLKVDYVGSVSGVMVDKLEVFVYYIGENDMFVIDVLLFMMECEVVDIYEIDGFDNFICVIVNIYVVFDVFDSDGKFDYMKLKFVLFEFLIYFYFVIGEIIGKCLNLDKLGMCVKELMMIDGIVWLLKIEVYLQYFDEYMNYVIEVGEIFLCIELGVLMMYVVGEKENFCKVMIFEIYVSCEVYEQYIVLEYFQKYKQGMLYMVKLLVLFDQILFNLVNKFNNFM